MTGENREHRGSQQRTRREPSPERYKVSVPARFLVTSLLSSYLLAFCVGRASRNLLFVTDPSRAQQEADNGSTIPLPYVSKTFDEPPSASSSSWLLREHHAMKLIPEDSAEQFDIENGNDIDDGDDDDGDGDDDDRDGKAVTGHLMVDINNVDAAFLNSERSLVNAMLEMVNEAKLKLLSYSCHRLVPLGVSCVGLVNQYYISIHTWPEGGVITVDLCTGGKPSLLSALSIIERLFGVPRTSPDPSGLSAKKPEVRWAHQFRGFEESSDDLSVYVLSAIGLDVKKEVSECRSV